MKMCPSSFLVNIVVSTFLMVKPFSMRKSRRRSYQALGACLSPYSALDNGWLLILQPVQRSLQNPNLQLERTPLQLVLPCSSQQHLDHLACSNDSCTLWLLFKSPNFIADEVIQLFMHGIDPIRIFKSIFYLGRLIARDKRVMSNK